MLTAAGHPAVVAAAPGHVAAACEYLIDEIEDLKAPQRIGSAVESAIAREGAH